MPDRGTAIINARKERVAKVLQRIEENPGIGHVRLEALLSFELGVSDKKIKEYLKTLGDAGLIVPETGCVWTAEAYESMKSRRREEEFLREEKIILAARAEGSSPIESYDTSKE